MASFIEHTRRAQIVASAIDVIAEHGYANASMDRIARHAGISRSLINYHFAGREDLLGQLVIDVFTKGADFMLPRVEVAQSPPEQLAAYITSNLDFIDQHRRDIIALVRVLAAADLAEGLPGIGPDDADQGLQPLRHMLREGQASGDFADFDPHQMAVAIRNVIDGVSAQLAANPDLDLGPVTREITTLFDRATRTDGELR